MSRDDKSYRVAIERARVALLMASGLTGAECKIALLMLERSNRDEYMAAGRLVSWMGEGTLATCARLTPDGARKARRALRRKGVFELVRRGGAGPGDTAKLAFSESWAERVEAEAKRDGLAAAWEGVRANPLNGAAQGGSPVPPKGVHTDLPRGFTCTPDSLDSNPLKEPLDGGAPAERIAPAAETAPAAATTPPKQPALLLAFSGGRGDAPKHHHAPKSGRRKPSAPLPWYHVDAGCTKDAYLPDAQEVAYLGSAFPLTAPDIDLQLVQWRAHNHRKPPKDLRDSFRAWMAKAEQWARERAQQARGAPASGSPGNRSGGGRPGALNALQKIAEEGR